MFKVILLVVMTSFLGIANSRAQATANSGIQSFKEWKGAKLQSLYAQIADLRSQYAEAKRTKNVRIQSKLIQQVMHLQGSYEMASELTVGDYFLLHINPSSDPNKFIKAAQKMSPEETALLMSSYSQSVSAASRSANGRVTTDLSLSVLAGSEK